MKRIVSGFVMAILLICLTFNYSLAQMPLKTQVGIKVGINISRFSGSDVPSEINSRTTMGMGLSLSIRTSNQFAIQPELLYMMKGAKTTLYDAEFNMTIHGTYKLSYIEIPILAKAVFSTAGAIMPEIYAGPAFAIKTSSRIKAEALGIAAEEDWRDIKSTDFGLVFGGGLGFRTPSGIVTFEGRYNLGLSSIDSSSDRADVKNGVFTIFMGYRFK